MQVVDLADSMVPLDGLWGFEKMYDPPSWLLRTFLGREPGHFIRLHYRMPRPFSDFDIHYDTMAERDKAYLKLAEAFQAYAAQQDGKAKGVLDERGSNEPG